MRKLFLFMAATLAISGCSDRQIDLLEAVLKSPQSYPVVAPLLPSADPNSNPAPIIVEPEFVDVSGFVFSQTGDKRVGVSGLKIEAKNALVQSDVPNYYKVTRSQGYSDPNFVLEQVPYGSVLWVTAFTDDGRDQTVKVEVGSYAQVEIEIK